MLANVDLIISGVAVVAVCSTQTWSVFGADLLLFFSAVAVYVLLSRHFKLRGRPSGCSCKDIITENCQEVLAECDGQAQAAVSVIDEQQAERESYVREQLALMRRFAFDRNVAGSMGIFRTLQQSGEEMTSTMYNIVMQAWINCGNVQAAEDWMEDIREAGMADLTSFNTLIKTLVMTQALDKAQALFAAMREAGIQPDIVTFNELLGGCANEGCWHEGLALLEAMHREGLQPNSITLAAIVNLMNQCRGQDRSSDRVRQIAHKFKLQPNMYGNWSGSSLPSAKVGDVDTRPSHAPLPVPVPRLMDVIRRADEAGCSLCQHEVEINGSLARIKDVRRSLKQHGFIDKDKSDAFPLDGHWETEHGLTVVIEGKLVRWSRQRASRLQFTDSDRRSCMLALYGEPTRGQIVMPGLLPGAIKTLRWGNGDAWHMYDGRVMGQAVLFSQTMTKVLRDSMQDQAYRARSDIVLRAVSRSGLCLPATIEHAVMQFLGNGLYLIRVRFESKWNPELTIADSTDTDPFDAVSRRNPRAGFRHCWAEAGKGQCFGQRTLVNGEEVDEECYNRHVKFVYRE